MKNFFHSDAQDPEAEFAHIKQETDLSPDNIQLLLKAAYDYADHLIDRRFEQICSTKNSDSKAASEKDEQKVQKLCQLLDDIKNVYQSFCSNNGDAAAPGRLDILYHLTVGNICMRIEQWHLDNYHYELAEQWYNMATGALWQGMNKIEMPGCSSDDTDIIYHLLLTLNIGKCFRNAAIQNRRSDFLASINKFEYIQAAIEAKLKNGGEISRDLALISADALINIARIHRYMYQTAYARKEFFCILASLFRITDDETISINTADRKVTVVLSSKDESGPYTIDLYDADQVTLGKESFTNNPELVKAILKKTHSSDRKAIILQLLIEFGGVLRKGRNYVQAIKTSIAADFYDHPDHNIDAINNISSSLRKYITTADFENPSVEPLIKDIQHFVFKDENIKLVDQLKIYAGQGNLYAAREFIRWHCDALKPKSKHANIRDWVGIDSAHPQAILDSLGQGLENIIKSSGSTCSDDTSHKKKNYSIHDVIDQINRLIKANFKESESYSKEHAEENVMLLYLRGCVELQFKCYDTAISTFTAVRSRKEANYIRRGTLGLKARYQLARCHMIKAEFRKAAEILQEIRTTLESSLKSRQVSPSYDGKHSDANPDFRVERDYGYCLMRLGCYQTACKIYETIHTKEEYKEYSRDQQIMSLNNYASCLIHTGKYDSEKLEKAKDILEEASESNQRDKVTNLLWGYYYVCQSDRETAQNYFDIAYGYDYDLNPDFYGDGDSKVYSQPDKAKDQNMVEQRSAYIINLTKIWKSPDSERQMDKDLVQQKIISFLSDISPACTLSLNAVIALAEWLCIFADTQAQNETLKDHLYRSFASVSVYPEHGSRAFMEFQADPDFRYFQSNERGKILARLFAMYRPIKRIKEELCLSQDDLSQEGTLPVKLFHYTDLATLKILLSEQPEGSVPHFRVCNCGYMNDVFEGFIFLDKMRDLVVSEAGVESSSKLKEWNCMVGKYFPHLVRSEENMIPASRNVYIASLSNKPDSFPLWSIYADNETGCNIEFGNGFFDILDTPQAPETLQDYLISIYTNDDYPIYRIEYLDDKNLTGGLGVTPGGQPVIQDILGDIYKRWKDLDTEIVSLTKKYSHSEDHTAITDEMLKSAINVLHTFAADRIDEVRFLFKDEDYKYEGEARVVVTTSKQPQVDERLSPPRVYAEVDRTIDNISVRLGSKIDDATVDQLVTWLKLTGKVRAVKLSKRNRRTLDTSR